ncbi:MAG TPA: class IIb bacteriocin, lactobin A/cerein 7B family [Glaciecola sp.]|mgnify:FL=1|jgi:lactobin A/cerein 7B family class IIb bacteriocin|nr:class IIb bacteriocin, lactobin A/cerein 7B family [Glaciecola sp.]
MKVLQEQELQNVNGGILPIVVAVVVYGELACFAAVFSGVATYNAIKNR